MVGERLARSLGQPVVVENKPGAGTLLGAAAVAKAAPDGYTLMVATSTTLGIAPALYQGTPFRISELTGVALLGDVTLLLVARPDFPASNVAELVAAVRAKPGGYNFASPGSGTVHHLLIEMLKAQEGLDVPHVPYQGSGQALTDMISGRIDFMLIDASIGMPQVRAGKIKLLAVASSKRSALAPDVPAINETYPKLDLQAWQSIAAPAGTPAAIVATAQCGHQSGARESGVSGAAVEGGARGAADGGGGVQRDGAAGGAAVGGVGEGLWREGELGALRVGPEEREPRLSDVDPWRAAGPAGRHSCEYLCPRSWSVAWKLVLEASEARASESRSRCVHTDTDRRGRSVSPAHSRDHARTHILDVANLIEWEELDDVVLCGHSYAGAVIAGVADRLPRRIRSLVYLDAFIPENGQGLSKNMPAERLQDGWKVLPIAAQTFSVNAADRAWVDRQCTPQSIDCWLQPSKLDGNHARNSFHRLRSGHGLGRRATTLSTALQQSTGGRLEDNAGRVRPRRDAGRANAPDRDTCRRFTWSEYAA